MTQANATLSTMGRSTFHLRSDQRLPVQGPVYFHNSRLQGTGDLWNVSLTGCRMDGTPAVPLGAVVELLMLLPCPTGEVLIKEATVCWVRGVEFGLRLVTVQPGEVTRLEQYITSHLR